MSFAMADASISQHSFTRADRLRLKTLIRLRWLALLGQSVTVLSVHYGFGFALPVVHCMIIIALAMILNLYLSFRFPSTTQLVAQQAAAALAFDILQLGALLYLTGGLVNPFVVLLLAPALVSAVTLPPRYTMLLDTLVMAVLVTLFIGAFPLPWEGGAPPQIPKLMLAGVLTALVLTLIFATLYAWRVSDENRQLSQALAATELVLTREQHLTALDGLAAAAAHELGTPLGTITLASSDLVADLPEDSPWRADAQLIHDQARRCRTILQRLATLEEEGDVHIGTIGIRSIIEEASAPYQLSDVPIEVVVAQEEGGEPIARRNPGVLFGLSNLIENAVDYAETSVVITLRWDEQALTVIIEDDGPGIPADIQSRLGEPFVTSRRRSGRRETDKEKTSTSTAAGGLGLGFFIAKTLLERSGASVTTKSSVGVIHYTRMIIAWPRSAFDVNYSLPETRWSDVAMLP